MWPMLLDMPRDECKRILRRLELEAYASIITAFRAQGALTKEKKNLLHEVASELNISMERCRAEVRRAVNDETLATIAELMAGPGTGTEWATVGRRLVPLMPRLVPQAVSTVFANNIANLTAAGNARLPVATAKLPGSSIGLESTSLEPVLSEGSKAPRNSPSQPSHVQSENTVQKPEVDLDTPLDNATIVLDISIKRELEDDDDEETKEKCNSKKMKTSSMGEAEVASSVNASPMSVSTTPSAVPASKVIIASSSRSNGSPSILQRSLSVPIVKTVTSIASSSASSSSSATITSTSSTSSAHSRGPTSYIINSSSGQSLSQSGTVVTISRGSSNENSAGSGFRSNTNCNMTATTGMNILPISGVANSGGSMAKILPIPAKGSSLHVVNASSSSTTTASQMPVVSRVVPTSVLSSSPKLNLPTSSISVLGTRTITMGTSNRINLNATAVAQSTSSPSSLSSPSPSSSNQLTTSAGSGGTTVIMHQTGRAATATVTSCNIPVTSATSTASSSSVPPSSVPPSSSNAISLGGACGKSNVIVVQKGPSGNTTFCRGVSLGTTTKEFVGKVFKGKTINPSSMTAITVQRRPATSNNTSAPTLNTSVNAKNLSSSSSQAYAMNNNAGTEDSISSADQPMESPPTPEAVEEISQELCHIADPAPSPALNISQTRVVTLEEAIEMFGISFGDYGETLLGKSLVATRRS